jgi:hypothetical protein
MSLIGSMAIALTVAILPAVFATGSFAQPSPLSLADVLVALRSKKAPLPDRNRLLADAVDSRGMTFALTPEIEKELSIAGADKVLLESLRKKDQIAKAAAKPPVPA